MAENKVKTPEQYAEKEMNKKIGKAIAKRQIKIKKLQEEVRKLKSGELQPDDEDEESSSDNQKEKEEVREVIKERIIEVERPRPFYIPEEDKRPFYTPHRVTPRWRTVNYTYC